MGPQNQDCLMCGLEQALYGRSREIREELQAMLPTQPDYDRVFEGLIYVDQSLRMLKGRARA